jgi:AcrR family transcriptional regulator
VEEDGRTAVRLRHRRAILAAALELIEEGDGSRFSADALAERAGVSRRTVFNHFASLDDVLLDVCTETLDVAVEHLRSQTPSSALPEASREAMFGALAQALRGADLSDRIIRVWAAMGGASVDDQHRQAFAQQALALVADRLSEQLTARNPGADPLDVDLLASLLTHGLGVIAGHWVATARPGRPPSPAEWDRLLELLLDRVGSGYLPRST